MMESDDQERLFRQRKRWIWGCTGGCLGLMIVVAAVIIGVYLWFARALPVPPAETFLTPDASAFLFVRIAPDDPMMVEVPVRLAVQPAVRSRVPTKNGRPLKVDPEQVRAGVIGVAPVQLVLVGTVAEGEERPHWGFAVSITRLGRLLDFVLRRVIDKAASSEAEAYKGGIILTSGEEAAFATRTNIYMAAERKPLLHAWLDGIDADLERGRQPEGEPPLPAGLDPQLLKAYDGLDSASPVRFACVNAHGEVAALLMGLPGTEFRSRLSQAGLAGPGVRSISGQLLSMNSRDAALTLRVACVDDAAAAAMQAALRNLVGGQDGTRYLRDPVVSQPGGGIVELTGRIENLPDRVAALVSDRTP